MGVERSIDISAEQRETILALLQRHLPGTAAWVYGSRARWTSRPESDLDLVVFATPDQRARVGALRDALEESDLPFRVDLFAWDDVSESFREKIEAEHVELIPKPTAKTHADWSEARWGDIATLEYGRALRGYDTAQGSFRVFGTNGPIGWHDQALCEQASVIVGRKGAYRGIHYSADPFFVIDTAFYLRPKVEMDARWAYYTLLTQDINGMDSGSAIPSTSRDEFYSLPVSVPPPSEQRGIAHILGTLDDKIELNRRMNETLEAMARALFKSWFVDFDPVRAKMEGRDLQLESDLCRRFPEALNDQGIPRGWHRIKLGEVITVLETGKRPRGGVLGISEGIPSVGAESITGVGKFDFSKTKYVPVAFFDNMTSGRVTDGDVLVYKDGGKPGELRPAVTYISRGFPFAKFCINEHVFRVRTDVVSQPLLYCALSTEDAFWQMRELATGVAQPGLNQRAMKSLEFTMPDSPTLVRAAESLIGPLIDGCNENSQKSFSLAQVRDALLPRLISGDIRIREAEKVIEAVE